MDMLNERMSGLCGQSGIRVRSVVWVTALLCALLSGCASPRNWGLHWLANQVSSDALADEADLELVRSSAPALLKVSESLLKELPGHRALARQVAAGFAQYAYAFVAFDAERIETTDARQAQTLRSRAAALYGRSRSHAMKALDLAHPGWQDRLAKGFGVVSGWTDDDIELGYWAAASWAASIALSKGSPETVADLPRVLDLVRALDRRATGRLGVDLATLLGTLETSRPGGSPDQAEDIFKRALSAAGDQASGVLVSMAESLAAPAGDRARFESLLQQALVAAGARQDLPNQVMRRRAQCCLRRLMTASEHFQRPRVLATRRRFALGLCAASTWPPLAWAQAAVTLRVASVVPRHSVYHQQLLELGEAWRAAQGAGARFSAFTDGTQGGEAEIVRRMRIGQLQGALLSVVGLRDIDPGIAALQSLPLLFRSWDEVDYVREKMRPAIEKRFLDKDFVVIGWGDAGWVRFFSREAARRPDDYKRMKFFAWGSEPEQQSIMKSLGYTPVPLETSDVLPAVQTGMIDVVPSTPYFALATQVYDTVKHMLEINWAPIVGAMIVTRKVWDSMLPAGQQALRAAGELAGQRMRTKARQEVDEAVEAMRKRGLTVHTPSPEQMREWHELAERLYPRIRGALVPAETFDEVFSHLKAYRASRPAAR
jgi:TRAP-type transport system periplasmic protein